MLHASWSARSPADSSWRGVSLRKHLDALDRLLLQRFGGEFGRGLAVESSRGRDVFPIRDCAARRWQRDLCITYLYVFSS